MKLTEISNNTQYTIACDMDGVLVSFITKANEVTGKKLKDGDLDKLPPHEKTKFWNTIIQHTADGNQFFGDMEPMPDARELWLFIKKHPHFILTSAGARITSADREKRQWVKKHLGQSVRVEVVPSAKAKAAFATPTTILIDDREKCIAPWVAAGGIGILHTSAASTIKQLKQLGL